MLKLLQCLLLLHQSLSVTTSVLLEEVLTYNNETDFKATFAYEVVDKIYGAFRQWFFSIIFCEFTYFENRILKYTETKDYGYPVMLLNSCPSKDSIKVKPKIGKHGQTAYIVTSNELTLENNDLAVSAFLRTGIFKPRSVVIFVINVPVEVDSYYYYAMVLHFQLLWNRKVTNSVLIVWSDKLRMYTYNHFFSIVKEITEVTDVSKLLSKQYNNLYGHELRVSVFRKIFLTDETGPVKCDSLLTTTVISFLNASCLPLAPRDGSTVGDLLDNGTATGVTGDLIDGYTDLELNSRILKNSYYGYIDTTYPLAQDQLCFLVKKEGKQSSFTTVVKLISSNMLIFFLFESVFLITTAVVSRKLEARVLQMNDKQTTTSVIMDMVKCFMKQTADITFLGPVFRSISLMIMLYSLVINCVIDGVITSAITYPRYKSDINTLDDLISSNLTFAVHNRHFKMFNKSLDNNVYDSLIKRVELFNDKKIKKAIDERQFQYAILLRKSDANKISRRSNNMKDGRPLFHTVQECPIPCSVVYGLKYGSPYLSRINYIINLLNQGGILQHWAETDDYNTFRSFGKIISTNSDKERKPLRNENVKEIFIVWSIGLAISVLAFILEIVLHTIETLVVV